MTTRNYPPYPSGSLLLARLFCYTIFGACCFVIGHWAGEVTASKNCAQMEVRK